MAKTSDKAAPKAAPVAAPVSADVADAEKDLEEKRQKLTEALTELNAAEQALPEFKVAAQQKYVDELKAKGVQYDDEGRQLGINGSPVSNPTMYGGNPAPDTLGKVH